METQKLLFSPESNRNIAAEPGVEPELYCSTPRPVMDSHSSRRQRIWCMNITIGCLALAYYNWTPGGEREGIPNYHSVLFLISAVALVLGWISLENELRRKRAVLRDGHALRATVESRKILDQSEPESVQLVYSYADPRPDGLPIKGHLTLTQIEGATAGRFSRRDDVHRVGDRTESAFSRAVLSSHRGNVAGNTRIPNHTATA